MDIPHANRFINSSTTRNNSRAADVSSRNSEGMLSFIQYVILCRVSTGMSSIHSVQIGPDEHAPIRLEVCDHVYR